MPKPVAPRRPRRSVKASWLAGEPDLLPFCGYPPFAPDWRAIATARGQVPVDRSTLAATLTRQYAGFDGTEAVAQNIGLLGQPTTFCVTTGQQPGLFGGPLYTLYKAISAIRLARALTAALPGTPVVPVFWVASEDHDVAEVNHTYPAYDRRVAYPDLPPGPVGRHILTDAIRPLTAGSPLLEACYTPGRTWGEAFRRLLHGLLGHHGLLVLEPDDPALKQLMAPAFGRELAEPGTEAAVHATTQALQALGYPAQIHPRAVNLFFFHQGLRLRIERTAQGTLTVVEGQPGDDAALAAAIAAGDWAAFSPNVVLRPVYQETVLPNLAYIGGWAEVAYWLQLKGVFERYGTFLPPVLPRASALLLTGGQQAALAGHDLPLEALLQPTAPLRRTLLARHWQGTELAAPLATLATGYQALEAAVRGLDPAQARTVAAGAARLDRLARHLRHRLEKTQAQQHPEWLAPALALRDQIQPPGHVQERTLGWLAFGEAAPLRFADWLLDNLLASPTTQPLVWPG
ncbi:MAG: bacillithiol biosynthesis BshC [Bacteroidia bacterium]|nr:bacillithiol biosynthesis BshC [Bacteroidia bacterium]